MTKLAPLPVPISSVTTLRTVSAYVSSSMSKPPSVSPIGVSGIRRSTSATVRVVLAGDGHRQER
ncbi:hypothetical protein SMICM304S_11905 [Streptomyces microflavus]